MSSNNRHLRGKTNVILGDVQGHVVVEAGDFMVRNDLKGLLGAGKAEDYYVYPFDSVKCATGGTMTMYNIYTYFIGVAMGDSVSGVTNKIPIATTGVFKYPMHANNGVTLGALVGAVSSAAAITTTGVSPQYVWNSTSWPGTTAYLGYITKTESGASFVEFDLATNAGTGRAA